MDRDYKLRERTNTRERKEEKKENKMGVINKNGGTRKGDTQIEEEKLLYE